MFEQSEAIDKLAPALAKVQATVEGAKKSSVNPHFKSKYADLAATWDACRGALTDNGFSLTQWPGEYDGKAMQMTTVLAHSSGQWQRGTLSIPLAKHDPQGYGSAVTYARRYALQAAVGLSPEDDDGNAASAPSSRPAATITQQQFTELSGLMEKAGVGAETFCTAYKIDAVATLPTAMFASAKKKLETTIANKPEPVKEAA